MKPLRGLIAASLLSFPALAAADPCPGASPFTDVATTDSFCTNTEWLKNRGVTTGCTLTTYCPFDPVSRAQMALFMNRLAVALTPTFIQRSLVSGAVDVDAAPVLCETTDVNTGSFPKTAVGSMTFAGLTGGNVSLRADLVLSTNGGTTWTVFDPGNVFLRTGDVTSGIWVNASLTMGRSLAANTDARFGIRVQRDSGTADLTDSRCFVSVQLINRNGTTSPLDEAIVDHPGEGL